MFKKVESISIEWLLSVSVSIFILQTTVNACYPRGSLRIFRKPVEEFRAAATKSKAAEKITAEMEGWKLWVEASDHSAKAAQQELLTWKLSC